MKVAAAFAAGLAIGFLGLVAFEVYDKSRAGKRALRMAERRH